MLSTDSIVQVIVSPVSTSAGSSFYHTGLLLVPSSDSEDASAEAEDRLGSYSSPAEMRSAGYAASSPAYLAALRYFGANAALRSLLVFRYPASSTASAALDEVLDLTTDFYGVFLCSDSAEEIQSLAAHMQLLDGRFVLFYAVTGTPAEAASSSGLLAAMQALHTSRALGIYASEYLDAASVLGMAMGLALTRASSAFALCYKPVVGMTPTPLTESQITTLKALNANVYVTRGASRLLLEPGAVASGQRFDEVLYLDRITADLREAAVSLLTEGEGRLPQTDSTSALFINRFSAVLADYESAGVLAPGTWRGSVTDHLSPGDSLENGFALWADSFDTQSDADRAAHRAMPIHVALRFAGSVETLRVDVDVSL